MEGSVVELSKYRYQRGCEDLDAAKILLNEKSYKSSVNRSYYAIFHGLRALTALDNFDSSKHSGVIAYINKVYVKAGVFEKSFSKMLDTAFRLREKADYQDFFIVSREMAEEQMQKAVIIFDVLKLYLEERWKSLK
jgi:uncharacterized protein (UPF0332 family)